MLTLLLMIGATDRSAAQSAYTEMRDTLADGTPYLIRVPDDWNGTLLRDLDYASQGLDQPRGEAGAFLLERGFALAGTARHRLRRQQYDPAGEIAKLDRVLDLFEEHFPEPQRVIHMGCSGGGHVTLAVAEDFAGRVDGALSMGAHTPVWLMNTGLDGWFVLKALIAPELPIESLPEDHTEIAFAWRRALHAAQRTAEGRARIALAFTVGQWPAWGATTYDPEPEPDPRDADALQRSMYQTVLEAAAYPGGRSRFMFEQAGGGQLSWNTGVDYARYFKNGDPRYRRAVRELYRDAGLDLDADLAALEASPRVAADPAALEFWNSPGRTVVGQPRIPVLRIHEVGDLRVPVSLVGGYESLVKANGKEDLLRTAFVRAVGHCEWTPAEVAASLETLILRLDRGHWGSTDADTLNQRAAAYEAGVSRFTRFDGPEAYNRGWTPEERR